MNNSLILLILFLTFGILVGFRIKRVRKYSRYIEKGITVTIFLLLFVLGIGAGANENIIKQIHSLGLTALTISLFTIAGSVILGKLVYTFFFKNNSK